MAKNSLANFCVVVLKNRRFRRNEFPFEKSIQPRLPGGAGCCLSYFRTMVGSKEAFSLMKGSDDTLWAILVHKPVRPTNRSPERSARVGGQWNLTDQEERHAVHHASPY